MKEHKSNLTLKKRLCLCQQWSLQPGGGATLKCPSSTLGVLVPPTCETRAGEAAGVLASEAGDVISSVINNLVCCVLCSQV